MDGERTVKGTILFGCLVIVQDRAMGNGQWRKDWETLEYGKDRGDVDCLYRHRDRGDTQAK